MNKLATIKIQGKDYVTVNERLKYFREQHPKYSITTTLVAVDSSSALIKASIADEEGRILAEGSAFETAGSSFINKTSHVENCETSAIGRALGFFGIGIDASVATADEVANAVLNQDRPARKTVLWDATALKTQSESKKTSDTAASDEQLQTIKELAEGLDTDVQKIYDAMTAGRVPNKAQAMQMIPILNKKLSTKLDSKAA